MNKKILLTFVLSSIILSSCGSEDSNEKENHRDLQIEEKNSQTSTIEETYIETTVPETTTSTTTTTMSIEESTSSINESISRDSTLVIYCWNTEFKSRFDKYYGDFTDKIVEYNTDGEIISINGADIEWNIISSENNEYQTELDNEILNNNGHDRVDLFLVESDFMQKYVSSDHVIPVEDLGITKNDIKNQYLYTKQIGTDQNTNMLKALSWQNNSGAFVYNAEYAEKVLGTADPKEIYNHVKTWTEFEKTAKKMKSNGIYMYSSFEDTYRLFACNNTEKWVDNYAVTIPSKINDWLDKSIQYSNSGFYSPDVRIWDENWTSGMEISGKVFGYFMPKWGVDGVVSVSTGDEGYGKWRICEAPESFYWGGSWLCAASGSDDTDIVADIMRVMTCNKDCMKAMALGDNECVNNSEVLKELSREGYDNDFLGGQNDWEIYDLAGEKISLSGLTAYDQGCSERLQLCARDYIIGEITLDEMISNFEYAITDLYSNLYIE